MFGGTIRLNPLGICVIIVLSVLFFFSLNTNILRLSDDSKNEVGKLSNFVDLRKLLIAAIEVAEKAGKEVVSIRKGDIGEKSKGKTKEGAKDVVTIADYRSHCIMYYGMKKAFPKVKVISEEQETEDCSNLPILDLESSVLHGSTVQDEMVPVSDVVVWIDPLDATTEYTENLLEYVATMACIAVKGHPVIGVIHKPFNKRTTYWGWIGKGMSENIKKIDNVAEHATKKIVISRSHTGKAKNITELAFGKEADVILAAGAGYKSIEVALQNANAYIHMTDIRKWDLCAGNAIINSIGGQMTTLTNQPLDYSANTNTVNSNGVLATLKDHEWFLSKLPPEKIS